MIEIAHTPEDGTVVTGDPRPHHGVLKDAGFRWSRNVGWYIRGSRDRAPQTHRIDQAAAGLRAAGLDVTVTLDCTVRDTAVREAARAERIDDRQDALDAKAVRLHATSDELEQRRRQMSDRIPFGQPILVGHHSEKRHRKDIARMQTLDRKSIDAYRDANETARRADASRAAADKHVSLPTTVRRIERLEAEGRRIDRLIAGKPCPVSGRRVKPDFVGEARSCPLCRVDVVYGDTVPEHFARYDEPADGEHLAQLLTRRDTITADVAYWTAHRDSLTADGIELLGPGDFKVGDRVLAGSFPATVERVNKKSLSVRVDIMPGHTSTCTYERIRKIEGGRR